MKPLAALLVMIRDGMSIFFVKKLTKTLTFFFTLNAHNISKFFTQRTAGSFI